MVVGHFRDDGTMTLDAWTSAVEAARTLAPATAWRERLVREVHRASGARFVLIATCPPDIPVEAQLTVAPRTLARVAQRILAEFLPRIEQAGSGVAIARRTRSQSYAPLLETRQRAIAAQVRRTVLSPEGIEGMLNAFLANDEGAAIGWLSLGTTTTSRVALRAHGEPLTAVAREAARTLTNAIDLAAACGARPVATDPQVASLTARERQVAALVTAGLSDANVAARLSLSEETVGSHLRRVYRKLHVHSRVALVARLSPFAMRSFTSAE